MSLALRAIRLLLLLSLLSLLPTPARAQLPGIPDVTRDVRRALGQEGARDGAAKAPVMFRDRILFRVSGASAEQAQARADQISGRLGRVLGDLQSLAAPPRVSVRVAGPDVVLLLDDTPLLTVTEADAEAAERPAAELAIDWAGRLERAFNQALEERRPEFLREAFLRAGAILLAGVLIHFTVWTLSRRFFDRPGWPLLLLVWISVIHWVLDAFPRTRPLNNLLSAGLLRPIAIIVVWSLIAAALSRLLGSVLHRIFPVAPETMSPEERTERTLRRRATLGGVLRVTGVTLIWVLAVVIMLARMGVNLGALLASAGLIGVAIGLAAQDSMKDFVAGINILADDRFGVGDVIQVGDYTGKVENLNLRVTQIRDISGRLITLPNRQIETVANLTSRWSQVDFKVGVSYEADLREALHVMERVARELGAEWPERILSPPEILGSDSYNPSDVTLRMLLRTAPGDQWMVERELRLRVKEAFDAAGISIPFPQRTVRVVDGAADVKKGEPRAVTR
jgi:small conductance mechanosensitive channel